MGVATNARAGRLWRTLLAEQTAKGTPVDDFTNAVQLWTTNAGADASAGYINPEWWMSFVNDYNAARYAPAIASRESFATYATPTLLESVLQSLFGTYATPLFEPTGYVAKWLTLAFIEDKTLVNTGHQFMRFSDTLVHELTLDVDANGFVDATCAYAAETYDNDSIDLTVVDGATLPDAPMDDVDLNVFPGRTVTLRRDPSGANTLIPFERLAITLNARADIEWDQCGQKDRVKKNGPTTATLVIQARTGDELWAALADADEDVKTAYRVTMTAPNGRVLTMTFHNVSFNVSPLTVRNQNYESPVLTGRVTEDLDENFVSVTLT